MKLGGCRPRSHLMVFCSGRQGFQAAVQMNGPPLPCSPAARSLCGVHSYLALFAKEARLPAPLPSSWTPATLSHLYSRLAGPLRRDPLLHASCPAPLPPPEALPWPGLCRPLSPPLSHFSEGRTLLKLTWCCLSEDGARCHRTCSFRQLGSAVTCPCQAEKGAEAEGARTTRQPSGILEGCSSQAGHHDSTSHLYFPPEAQLLQVHCS